MKSRIKAWAIIVVLSFALVQLDNWHIAREKEKETQQITVNAPQAMHEAFEKTLEKFSAWAVLPASYMTLEKIT